MDLIGRRFFSFTKWAKKANEKYLLSGYDYTQVIYAPCLSGCFMFLRVSTMKQHYLQFDDRYFMYCEDIDLCMRLKLSGIDLYYTPHFNAVHYAQHENRRIFTKAFRWHIRSITRYILRKPILSYKNYRKITSELVK